MEQDSMKAARANDAGDARVRLRPEPARTQPIRNWGGILNGRKVRSNEELSSEELSSEELSNEELSSEELSSEELSSEEGVRVPRDPTSGAFDPRHRRSADFAREGVAAGYRVIDDLVREGQRAARDFSSPSAARAARSGAADEPYASRETAAGQGPDVSTLGERWLRSLGELGSNWLELMQAMSRSGNPQAPEGNEGSAGPFAAGRHATNGVRAAAPNDSGDRVEATAARITVSISAPRPVFVQVDVKPEGFGSELQVGPLGDASGELPRIRGARVSAIVDSLTNERCVTIEADIDPEQPSGTYHAVLLARAKGRPIGTLTLCLS